MWNIKDNEQNEVESKKLDLKDIKCDEKEENCENGAKKPQKRKHEEEPVSPALEENTNEIKVKIRLEDETLSPSTTSSTTTTTKTTTKSEQEKLTNEYLIETIATTKSADTCSIHDENNEKNGDETLLESSFGNFIEI